MMNPYIMRKYRLACTVVDRLKQTPINAVMYILCSRGCSCHEHIYRISNPDRRVISIIRSRSPIPTPLLICLGLPQPNPSLILSGTFPILPTLAIILPKSRSPQLRPPLRLPISIFHILATKLRPALRLIHSPQAPPEHLIRHIAPTERKREIKRAADIDTRNCTLVLILAVDVGTDAVVEEVGYKPVVGFASEGLFWTTEVGEFGGVDAGKTDMNLVEMINQRCGRIAG